jgi:hypothetical protein
MTLDFIEDRIVHIHVTPGEYGVPIDVVTTIKAVPQRILVGWQLRSGDHWQLRTLQLEAQSKGGCNEWITYYDGGVSKRLAPQWVIDHIDLCSPPRWVMNNRHIKKPLGTQT